jgi:hypothetical protein
MQLGTQLSMISECSQFILVTMSTGNTSLFGTADSEVSNPSISPIRAIAIILAHGVVRLHKRQKELDNSTEQSVHDCVLVTKGETQ